MPLLIRIFAHSLSRPLVHSFTRWVPIIGALALAVSLGGCSAVRLGYNNAPGLATWWLDDYFDFDTDQSARLRTELEGLIVWHRKEELPLFAEKLKNLRGAATQPITPEQVCAVYTFTLTRMQSTAERLAPTLAGIAPTLQAAQLEHLSRQFDKRNREWRKEWMDGSAAQRIDRRVEKLVDRAESFYGRLDAQQRSALRTNVLNSAFNPELSYREVLRRQQDTLQTLKTLRTGAYPEGQAQALIRALLERSLTSPDATYRQYLANMTAQSCTSIANLHNSASPSQRDKLAQVLLDYENEVRALMNP
jgi:HPt (histidine-containing phosphotransfer) domain-containing protein